MGFRGLFLFALVAAAVLGALTCGVLMERCESRPSRPVAKRPGQGVYIHCQRWPTLSNGLRVGVVWDVATKLGAESIDMRCAERNVERIVRKLNGMCGDEGAGAGVLDDETFAHAIVSEFKERCP